VVEGPCVKDGPAGPGGNKSSHDLTGILQAPAARKPGAFASCAVNPYDINQFFANSCTLPLVAPADRIVSSKALFFCGAAH
jgi:hypothetical protein